MRKPCAPAALYPRSVRGSMDRRAFLSRLGIAAGSTIISGRRARRAEARSHEATFQLRAPEPNARPGGTLRYGVPSSPAHFDIHQSGTVANLGAQAPMYDNLVRRDPRDGQTIIPDLAWKWDVAPDGKRYTFHLRRGVQFHDGTDLTADDVKATFARIVSPPKGVVMPRAPLFSAVGQITALDPHRIEFKLREPRPPKFMLAAFASGFNVVVRKKSLDDNDGNLRQIPNYPGTGPFRHVSRKKDEVWVLERNPHYWNKGLPYLDRLEIYHAAAFSPELGASLLAGKLDYARIVDTATRDRAKTTAGMTAATYYQSAINAAWMNTQKKPFGDPRVRRALHQALDRHVLIDVVKESAPYLVGGFIYPFSEWATPAEELSKRPGYQRDPKVAAQDARRLLTDAGHPNGLRNVDVVVRDGTLWKLWAVAIQAMLKDTLNVETKLRTVQVSAFFEETQAGNFDLAIGTVASTLIDPSDYFHGWYGKDGPQNYSKWANPAFEKLVVQIDREVDDARRKSLVRQVEKLLEDDPPLLPVAWEQLADAWWTHVKGVNPRTIVGIYDVVRWDTVSVAS
jgi:peptide/nickel transport system substrate-binding protein